ncbi:MAG: LTA synthase family protein [Vallitaleaceae bacterium]|nr:LTA synthase family protein [Vallitaleaceae bacterium]
MKLFIKNLRLLDLLFAFIVISKIIYFYILTGATNRSIVVGLITFCSIGVTFYYFLFTNKKYSWKVFAGIYAGITLMMYLDCLYYSYFNQLLSINQIFQVNKLVVINDSFKFVAPPISTIMLLDIPFVGWYFKKLKNKIDQDRIVNVAPYKKAALFTLFALIVFSVVNPFNADSVKAINHNEVITYHLYDLYTKVFGDKDNLMKTEEDVLAVLADNKEPLVEQKQYEGIGKGKNLIVIQVESLQNFAIGKSYEGQELTPNLNKLIKKDTIYFDNYYTVIGKGNTADAEFATMNSLYPNIEGSCYENYDQNTFYGLPWVMKENGYSATAYHGYLGDFWNREAFYKVNGFDDFKSEEDYNVTTRIGFGMADEEMLAQTTDFMKKLPQPFFSFVITLSCHHPYIIPEEYAGIEVLDKDKGTVFGNYMQGVHYSDQALGQFIESLKANGLYEDSVIVLYGDHYALNCKLDEIHTRMSEYLGYDYSFDEMLKIPLMIHIPGEDITSRKHISGGQIDFLPTIANIMGVEIKNSYIVGRDLLNAKNGFTAFVTFLFRGSFVADDVMFQYSEEDIYENSKAWNMDTLESVNIEGYQDENTRARNLLDASKYILDNNLIQRK